MAEQSRSPATPATTITDLNEDCIAHCAGHLSLGDVCNMAMTSSALKRLAYSDSIWQRFFREHWHLELPWHSSGNGGGGGARGVYMVRHAALRQFKFVDPFVLDFDAHAKPFDQLLLHKNHLFYSQGSRVEVIDLDGCLKRTTTDFFHSLCYHKARITCMRVQACGALEVTMVLCCPYQINYWERMAAKYWQVEEKMVLFDYGPLAQVANEDSVL